MNETLIVEQQNQLGHHALGQDPQFLINSALGLRHFKLFLE